MSNNTIHKLLSIVKKTFISIQRYKLLYIVMIYIAHRGNLNGPDPENENKPSYLLEALCKGFYIETDVWLINDKLMLGHDEPQYETTVDFLENDKIFCHTKNIEALDYLIANSNIHCFFHDGDDYTITSKNKLWAYPGKRLTMNTICVMPERVGQNPVDCFGVCTDYPVLYSNISDTQCKSKTI